MREPGKQRRPLERMSSVDRVTFIDRGEMGKENGEREKDRRSKGAFVGCAVVCIFFVSFSLCLCVPLSPSVQWTCVLFFVLSNTRRAELCF